MMKEFRGRAKLTDAMTVTSLNIMLDRQGKGCLVTQFKWGLVKPCNPTASSAVDWHSHSQPPALLTLFSTFINLVSDYINFHRQ